MNRHTFFSVLFTIAFATNLMAQNTVYMEREGNAYYVRCIVNGLPMKMLFDTGAESVSLSLSEAMFMVKNGYLSETDIGNTNYYSIANGENVEGMEINLREIEIGGIRLRNVSATIINSLSAPLLFGQSAIQRLGPIQINGNKLTILQDPSGSSESQSNHYSSGSTTFEYYIREADYYNKNEEYDKAIESCSKASENMPSHSYPSQHAMLFYQLGRAFAGKENYSKAAEMLSGALHFDPDENTAYHLGMMLFFDNQLDTAYRTFKRCINMIDRGVNLYGNKQDQQHIKACCYSYLAKIDYQWERSYQAEQNAKTSLSIEPMESAYYTLADIYFFNKKDYKKALDNYERGLAFDPNSPSNIKYYTKAGSTCMSLAPDADAEKYIDKGIHYFTKVTDMYDEIVSEFGADVFDDILEMRSCVYFSALHLGMFYATSNDINSAKRMYNKAMNARKNDVRKYDLEDNLREAISGSQTYSQNARRSYPSVSRTSAKNSKKHCNN